MMAWLVQLIQRLAGTAGPRAACTAFEFPDRRATLACEIKSVKEAHTKREVKEEEIDRDRSRLHSNDEDIK